MRIVGVLQENYRCTQGKAAGVRDSTPVPTDTARTRPGVTAFTVTPRRTTAATSGSNVARMHPLRRAQRDTPLDALPTFTPMV